MNLPHPPPGYERIYVAPSQPFWGPDGNIAFGVDGFFYLAPINPSPPASDRKAYLLWKVTSGQSFTQAESIEWTRLERR